MQLGLNSYLALLPNGTNRNGGIEHPASPVPVQFSANRESLL